MTTYKFDDIAVTAGVITKIADKLTLSAKDLEDTINRTASTLQNLNELCIAIKPKIRSCSPSVETRAKLRRKRIKNN